MFRFNLFLSLITTLCASVLLTSPCMAEKTVQQSIEQGIEFLRISQADDGSWTSPTAPGITAIATRALLESGVAVDDPTVKAGLEHLKSHLKEDGGIYYEKSTHRNYETSIAMMAFISANKDGRYDELIENSVLFLKHLQWDYEEGVKPEDTAFGGSGYGSHQRPDLSNTTFFLEALNTAGIPSSDPSVQNALMFISRCQNRESEHNTTPFASKVNDGGFYYTPAAGGTSQAGTNPDGGLRSYASMTYAGLKSMIYAGLREDDPRVIAARNWIHQFYSVTENPGMGQQGLFYYYHTFAKTLSVLKVDQFEDAAGVKHDWKKELANVLLEKQAENGSWTNPQDRWYEGDPNLVTSYTLLSLKYCQ